jgi:glutamate synthase domain-containing protein 2
MSFGSLSGKAVEALNRGAKLAGCLQNTGEGGTGAAPLLFADSVSLPFRVGFSRVYAAFAERASRTMWSLSVQGNSACPTTPS